MATREDNFAILGSTLMGLVEMLNVVLTWPWHSNVYVETL